MVKSGKILIEKENKDEVNGFEIEGYYAIDLIDSNNSGEHI